MRFLSHLLSLMLAIVTFGVTNRDGIGYSLSGNQDRRPLHWFDGLKMLDPEITPFVNLTMKLDRVPVSDPKYNLFEDDDRQAWDTLAEALDNSETGIDVTDGTKFMAGHRVLVVETGEVFTVSSVSSNTLTVTRGSLGTTAAAAVTAGDLLILGNQVYEGDNLPSIKTTQPVTKYNYVQIFREAYGYSLTNAATKKRGGPNDPERDRLIAMREFKKSIERAFRWGTRYEGGSGSSIERTTGGFESLVTTNVFDVDGGLSRPDILRIVERVTRYGSPKKLWICGREARLAFDALGFENELVPADRNWIGVDITRVRTSFGEFGLITDHMNEQGYADRIHIVDPTKVKMAVLRGVQHLENRQNNDEDLVKNEFLCEVGLYLDTESAHGVVKGITAND